MDGKKKKTMPCGIVLMILMISSKGYGQESVMTHLRYDSEINHRYAVTWVTANMKNPSDSSTEIFFKMTLPKTAFISGLIMEVGGTNYTSRVEDKKAAKETYNKAKKRGKHAGLVEQSEDTEQKFQVSTNVEARGKVIFYLKYEELLLRSKGEYTQNIQIKPGVKPYELDVTVHIKESEEIIGLQLVTTPLGPYENNGNGVMDNNSNDTLVDIVNPNEAVVHYHSSGPTEGLYGELTLTYDVKRKMDAGEIQVSGGYFVHFFSPDGLPKMAAHTVFILDISGSMSGEKLRQLKQSMKKILRDLKPEDSFELLTFHSSVNSLGVYNAGSSTDMNKAKKLINRLDDQGSTNINDALLKGFENVLKRNQSSADQVVFLTDGEPTVGETKLTAILRNVRETNNGRLPLYSLAFGNDADFKFLNQISFNNRGFARKIPVDSNTDEILRGFYQEIGTPLMTDIDIKYPEEAVDQDTIVKKGWSTLQSGNEVIVAGQLKPGIIKVLPKVDGVIKTGSHQFKVPRETNTANLQQKENFIARLWAYLTIQDLLKTAELTDDKQKVEELNARARSLALKHNFVTKLTSLVVVRPEDLPTTDLPEEDIQTEEPLKGSLILYDELEEYIDAFTSGKDNSYDTYDSLRVASYPDYNSYVQPSYDSYPDYNFDVLMSANDYGASYDYADDYDLNSYDGSSRLSYPSPPRGPHSGSRSVPISRSSGRGRTLSADSSGGGSGVSRSSRNFFADHDPHFVLQGSNLDETICFDFHGNDGDTLNLIHDIKTGTLVNGRVSASKVKPEKTFFTEMFISLFSVNITTNGHGMTITYKNQNLQQNNSKRQRKMRISTSCQGGVSTTCVDAYQWKKKPYDLRYGNVSLKMERKKLHIHMDEEEAHYVVVRSKNKHMSFLGFYIELQKYLTNSTTGLLGEFVWKPTNVRAQLSPVQGNMKRKYKVSDINAVLLQRKSMLQQVDVDCLFIPNDGEGLLSEMPSFYIRPCLAC